jgi:kinesin family protein 5
MVLQVQVKKAVKNKDIVVPTENGNGASHKGMRAPTIRRSKLLIVDLAGSERVDKSGWFMDMFSLLATKPAPFSTPVLL